MPGAEAGEEVALPPRSLTPRTAYLIALGDDATDCQRTLDTAEDASHVRIAAPPETRLGPVSENAITRRFLNHERGVRRMTVSGVRGDAWFRYGAGGGEGLNRPALLSAGEKKRLEEDLRGLFNLMEAVPARLFDGDTRAFARAVGMSETQADLVLRNAVGRLLPLARADMYKEADGFRVMELNTGTSLGGWQMGIFARALLKEEEFARFAAEEGLEYPDPLSRIVQVMREEVPGLAGIERPFLAITDWPAGFEKTKCWMDFVAPGFEELGFDVAVCHVGDFSYEGGRVLFEGRAVDVVYRMFLPGEMPDDQSSFDLVNPLLDAHEGGGVHLFAPLDCELYGNKGTLAMLSDERNRSVFSDRELELIDRILPWTRFVRDEKVTVDGEKVDLLPYALAEKNQLVLKPTLMYGGVGVITGWHMTDADWEKAVRDAVGGPFVLQRRLLPVTERFLNDDGAAFDEMAVAYGVLLLGGEYSGALIRGVPDPDVGIVSMINGAQIGCAFHVGDQAEAGDA